MSPLQQTALEYLKRGYSVIPLEPQGKKPVIPWTPYQSKTATEEEVREWFGSGKNHNLGIITGSVSGITIVDFDTPEAVQLAKDRNFPPTPLVKTGKGFHAYCRYREGHRNFQKRADLPGVDLRGEGGYVVAPPSVHSSGRQYEWIAKRGLGEIELAEVPEWIIANSDEERTPIGEVYQGVGKGNRNEALARVAGSVIAKGDNYKDALQFCLTWNARNKPPLSEREIEATVKSIWQIHQRNKPLSTPCRTGESPPQDEIESLEWPILSKTALPEGLVADFVNLACKNSEADPAAVLATFLVRFGIECGNNPHMMVGESRHSTRLNAVICGESSKARKGTSAGPVKSLFTDIGESCRVSPGPLSSGEGIIYAVRDEQREWKVDKKSGAGEWVVSDPGVDDKRLFVLDEEFANALNATKREGNTLSSILRCLFDDGNAEPLTKSNRTKTTRAHVGIVTHITLFELKTRLTENEQLNGFGNRFLWVCAKRNGIVPFPEPMNPLELSKLKGLIEQRISSAKTCERLEFTADAKLLWGVAYPRLSMAHSGLSGCMVNRGEALVIRLSLIYALLAGHDAIEREDLESAIAFWNYCYVSAIYIFGGTAADSRKNRIMAALEKTENGIVAKSDIRRDVFSNHIPAEALDAMLNDMETDGMIDLETVTTGGAPKTLVKIKTSCAKSAKSLKSPPMVNDADLFKLKTLKTQNNFENDAPCFSGIPLIDFDEEPIATGGAS